MQDPCRSQFSLVEIKVACLDSFFKMCEVKGTESLRQATRKVFYKQNICVTLYPFGCELQCK